MNLESLIVPNINGLPKYKQIIQSVFLAIEGGKLKKGDQLPSINAFCDMFGHSRDTVLVALNELKAKGVVVSVPGKGYFIDSVQTQHVKKIFVLFDELNAFKEVLYNSFVYNLKSKAIVDIYFHHFNRQVFKNLINDNVGDYTSYVIMPANLKDCVSLLKVLPADKVFILDQTNKDLMNLYPSVFQDFSSAICDALDSGIKELRKYKKITLVFPGGKEPLGQLEGFNEFKKQHANEWEFEVIANLDNKKLVAGELFIVPDDKDLVKIVKSAKAASFVLGKDIGVISYNDTPLKEIVADGISTISTDFELMGKKLAQLVKGEIKGQFKNPSSLIVRNSF